MDGHITIREKSVCDSTTGLKIASEKRPQAAVVQIVSNMYITQTVAIDKSQIASCGEHLNKVDEILWGQAISKLKRNVKFSRSSIGSHWK